MIIYKYILYDYFFRIIVPSDFILAGIYYIQEEGVWLSAALLSSAAGTWKLTVNRNFWLREERRWISTRLDVGGVHNKLLSVPLLTLPPAGVSPQSLAANHMLCSH